MAVPLNSHLTASPMRTLSTPVSDLPQAEVDAIIRTKRKAREPKACYPCHTRKVKCDRNLPCDGCVKRDHADLCSYERPSKKRQTIPYTYVKQEGGDTSQSQISSVPGSQHGTVEQNRISLSKDEWENVCTKLREMEQTISSLRTGMERAESGQMASPEVTSDHVPGPPGETSPEREGIHTTNELGDGMVHLGSRSVLAYLLRGSGASQEATQALTEGGILPKLGLDNETATYPFVDLWSSDASTFDINAVCSALPDDELCRRLLSFYREIAATLYPVLSDIGRFEANVETLLRNRLVSGAAPVTSSESIDAPYGMGVSFIGLLFAVLAAGCQSSDLPASQRELSSQVYICCSYQCLRATNFLSRPTIDAIQTLLLIGNVLSHNMNPGVSYILLGMTLRMGLSLGLHVESHKFSEAERHVRRTVWWSTAWQDSHFSLSYDRPSTMAFSHPDIPYRPNSRPGNRSFFETLCRIIALTMEVVRGRMLAPNSQMTPAAIQAYKDEIKRIIAEAAPYLHDPKFCTTPKENLERLALKLHSSYIASELCRPALKSNADMNDNTTIAMRKDCIQALIRTVQTYVELHSANPHASRSWIGLQRTVSAAFLLAVLGETKTDPMVRSLLFQLEQVLAERAGADGDQGATPATSSSSAQITSPTIPGSAPSPDIISGVTNIPTSILDPAPTESTMPANIPLDAETQWAKPLTKPLRALHKLNAAFSMQQQRDQVHRGLGGMPPIPQSPNLLGVDLGEYPRPSLTSSGQTLPVPAPANGAVGLPPPPTPDSSGSGDWNIPNLLDRAAEYIHPPLWP